MGFLFISIKEFYYYPIYGNMASIIIKVGSTSIPGATVKGSFSYFSGDTTHDLGPTSLTGFYSGIDAPAGGYTVYQIGGPNGWTARVATDDSSLNSILIGAGATGSTVNENISWASSSNLIYLNSGATIYTVGESALGGIIAYILQSGDTGYVAGVQHGLVASSINIPWPGGQEQMKWYNGSYVTTNATGSTVGTGQANTNLIISVQGTPPNLDYPYGAWMCDTYSGGGYTDWYLPSRDELTKVCNASILDATRLYMSSTEVSNTQEYIRGYPGCGTVAYAKANSVYVRAIRSF